MTDEQGNVRKMARPVTLTEDKWTKVLDHLFDYANLLESEDSDDAAEIRELRIDIAGWLPDHITAPL